jgi:hypothetical protein
LIIRKKFKAGFGRNLTSEFSSSEDFSKLAIHGLSAILVSDEKP